MPRKTPEETYADFQRRVRLVLRVLLVIFAIICGVIRTTMLGH